MQGPQEIKQPGKSLIVKLPLDTRSEDSARDLLGAGADAEHTGQLDKIIARGQQIREAIRNGIYSEQSPPPELARLVPKALIEFLPMLNNEKQPVFSSRQHSNRPMRIIPFLPNPFPFDTSGLEIAAYAALGVDMEDLVHRTRFGNVELQRQLTEKSLEDVDIGLFLREEYKTRHRLQLRKLGGFALDDVAGEPFSSVFSMCTRDQIIIGAETRNIPALTWEQMFFNIVWIPPISEQKMSPITNPRHQFDLPSAREIDSVLKQAPLTINPKVQIPSLEDFCRRYPAHRPMNYHGESTKNRCEPLPSNGQAHHPHWQADMTSSDAGSQAAFVNTPSLPDLHAQAHSSLHSTPATNNTMRYGSDIQYTTQDSPVFTGTDWPATASLPRRSPPRPTTIPTKPIPTIHSSQPSRAEDALAAAAATKRRLGRQQTVDTPNDTHKNRGSDSLLQEALKVERRAADVSEKAYAEVKRHVNNQQLEEFGHEMNPQMFTRAEQQRVIVQHGGVPEYWRKTYTGGMAPVVQPGREENPVWKDEYGMEEVRECLYVDSE